MTFHYNCPVRTREFRALEVLVDRMQLPGDAARRLDALRKGFAGEVWFSDLLRSSLVSDCIVLYDLLRKENDTLFQLDCVIILQRKVLHLEVKNYQGDFLFDNGQFFDVPSGNEVKNPLIQLERGQFLLKRTLGRLG